MTQRIHLGVPVSERDHRQGPATAAIILVQYGDYECPYTRQSTTIVRAIQQQLGDQLRFVFRNFPLTAIHPHALHAAFAAEVAAAQGKFWQMHDYIFLCWLLWSSVQKISLLSLFGDDHDAFHMPFFRTDVRSSHNNNYVGGYCLNKRVGRL